MLPKGKSSSRDTRIVNIWTKLSLILVIDNKSLGNYRSGDVKRQFGPYGVGTGGGQALGGMGAMNAKLIVLPRRTLAMVV